MDYTVLEGTLQSGTVDFTQGDGSIWRRYGGCNGCGQCCQTYPTGPACIHLGQSGCTDKTDSNPLYVQGCLLWPNHPSQLGSYPSCSYTFERMS